MTYPGEVSLEIYHRTIFFSLGNSSSQTVVYVAKRGVLEPYRNIFAVVGTKLTSAKSPEEHILHL